MTTLIIDVRDFGAEANPRDYVMLGSPYFRRSTLDPDRLVSSAFRKVDLSAGKATLLDVEPGPLRVEFHVRNIVANSQFDLTVPESGEWSLAFLMEQVIGYEPPIVSEVFTWAEQAREAADRVGTAEQVGEWAADAQAAASSAQQIDTTLPTTIQTELDARVPPMVPPLVAATIADEPQIVAAAAAAAYAKQTITPLTTEDLNTITIPGDYAQSSSPNATPERHYPFADRFSITVRDPNPANPNQKTQVAVGANTLQIAVRDLYGDGNWSEWTVVGGADEQIVSDLSDRVTSMEDAATAQELGTVDLNTLLVPRLGGYVQTSALNATPERHYPINERGVLEVVDYNPINPNQKIHIYTSSQSLRLWIRSIYGANNWSAWREIGGATVEQQPDEHAIGADGPHRKQELLRRKGGQIGTGGRGVIALRFDHSNPEFQTTVLPLLKQRGLPYTHAQYALALSPWQEGGYAGDTQAGLTWEQVQDTSVNQGGEIFSHSYTHADTTDYHREIVESRDYLMEQMPEVVVEGFAQPGIAGTAWEGMALNLSDPNQWRNFEAGRLIRDSYALYTGSGPLYWPLTSDVSDGIPWTGMDSMSSATSAINIINACAAQGYGAVLMLHPNAVDTSGKITTATLTQILDHLVAKRDAGEIMVLTMTGMSVASTHHAYRSQILEGTDFDLSRWQGTAGWSATGGVASTTTGGLIKRPWTPSATSWALGGAREASCEFRAPQGAVVSVRMLDYTDVTKLDTARQVTLPASESWVTVRQPFLIPRTTQGLHFEVGRVSGGPVEMRNPGMWAI